MIPWVTETIASSARWYDENAGVGGQSAPPRVDVSTGYADFPGAHVAVPHVAELFVDEPRGFFRMFR